MFAALKAEVMKLINDLDGEARRALEAALAAAKAEEATIAGQVQAAVITAKTDLENAVSTLAPEVKTAVDAALAKLVADIQAALGHVTP